MNWRKYRLVVLGSAALLIVLLALQPGALRLGEPPDQWQPIVAKYREFDEQVDQQGKGTIVRERRGSYFRSASGSVLTNWADVTADKAAPVSVGTFVEASTGHQYALDYSARTAKRSQASSWAFLALTRNRRPPQSSIVANALVNGINCFAMPVTGVRKDKTIYRKGLGWIATDYAFVVKYETEDEIPSGKIRSVKEKYDIQVGVEPVGDLVRIPEGFTVVK